MNRDQKAATIAEIAANIEESQAVFAVDYRGISVPQIAELRAKLREADASFRVVKNSLTERAADQTGTEQLKPLLQGPTALTFVRGDAALAAKAVADYARLTQLLPFKGGLMEGAAVDAEQIRAISRLPSREVLYGQLVGVVASPISGLVRALGALVGGLAVALGQVQEKKESGEIPAGGPPASAAPATEAPPEEAPAAEGGSESASASASESASVESSVEDPAAPAPAPAREEEEPSVEESSADAAAAAETAPAEEPHAEGAPVAQDTDTQAAPADEPAQDDNQADASAEAETAEANPKED